MNYKTIFSLNPGRSRSLFLELVPVEGLTLNDVGALKEKVFVQMEKALRENKV